MNKSLFSKVDHIGIIVKDMEATAKRLESLGIGPFEPLKITVVNKKDFGKPSDDFPVLAKAAKIGNIKIELLQPVSGESVQNKYLQTRGEGFNHVGFSSENAKGEIAGLKTGGLKSISEGQFTQGGAYAYFETDPSGDIIFELIQWPENS
jgi:methylmalonyl-CoA/ethylmalonyl-CoA epimerase